MLGKLVRTGLLVLWVLLPSAAAARRAPLAFEPAAIDARLYTPKVSAFEIIVDGSASMRGSTRENRKIDVVRTAAQSLAASIPELDYRGGVRSIGEAACAPDQPTCLLRGVQRYSRADAKAALAHLRDPGGFSHLSVALDAAAHDLAGASGETAVILVSDGLQMGDDAVEAARRLHRSANANLYAIQIGKSSRGTEFLQRVVLAGGRGRVVDAWGLTRRDQMGRLVVEALLNPAPGANEISEDLLRVPVQFDFGSATIPDQCVEELSRLAQYLQRTPDVHIAIEGHADSVGGDAYNQRLSERRACAIRDYLVSHGVDSARLTPTGFGESKPLYANDTPYNRAKNRRTEFRRVQAYVTR